MRLFLVLLFLASPAFAQTFTLTDALESVAEQDAILSAQAELEDARMSLTRAEADPLGTRLALVEAEQRFVLAEAALKQAYNEAALETRAAYAETFTAQAQLELLEQQVALNERLLQAAEVRLKNGSATELDVQEATTQLESARKDLRSAQERLSLARTRLESLVGSLSGDLAELLTPLSERYYDLTVPPADVVLSSLEAHLTLQVARQERKLAEVNADILDPLYSSPASIATAQAQSTSAREEERRAERVLRLEAQGLLIDAQEAKETCEVSVEARTDARERLAFEQRRLESGLLSEIQFLQAEIDANTAEATALQTCTDYLNALSALQAGTTINVGLPSVPERGE